MMILLGAISPTVYTGNAKKENRDGCTRETLQDAC
jgi:hypothetical protein